MSHNYSITQITKQLKHNIKTIHTHKFNIISKLNINSNTKLLKTTNILLYIQHYKTNNILHPY